MTVDIKNIQQNSITSKASNTDLKASQQIRDNGFNKALKDDELKNASIFLMSKSEMATINYGEQKGEISEEDAKNALAGKEMSAEGQSAFQKLKARLQENLSKVLDFFSNNKEVGENNSAFSDEEFSKLDTIMSDGIVTDEELAEIVKNADEAKEEAQESKKDQKPKEAGEPGRAEEVKAAFDAFMSDLVAEREFDIKKHPGINEGDYNGIINDFKDDGIIGNGARREQFMDNTIYEHAVKVGRGLKYTDKNGKEQTLKGVHDANDNRTHYFNKNDDKKKIDE